MSTSITLYEHLADELGALIHSRVFAPGDRLPSIRHLAQQKRLSVSTVMQAFRLMEDRGQVDARPQAGYYVRHRISGFAAMHEPERPLTEPAFVGINNLLMRVLSANEKPNMVQLGTAWPPDEMLPIKRMQRIVSAVARREPGLLNKVSCYDISEPGFLRQVTRRALDWGKLDPHEIVVTNSCTEAISLCLRAVAKPGDTIAIESATYFVLLQMIESLGMKALEIPTHPKTGLSLDALELALRAGLVQACLFIPNVNNPLGCIMPEENKKRLAGLLSEHNIPMIEDDVYGDLCFGLERPWPVKAYDSSGHVLLCSSFSKAITPSARVGYVVAGRYAQEVALLKTVSSGATSQFFQAVLADFLAGSSYDSQLRKMRRTLVQRMARMSDAVAASFPPGCLLSEPQGGFVLWVQMPQQLDALALHGRAIGQGVAFMPGQLFSASGKYRNYLRLNCGNPWGPEIERAVGLLGRMVHQAAGT
ncbi:aminotransferase-like domain-containing protein [Janthinobacterium agaricidamnosum]|uniref:Bacterial regulatory s, gntR family protein n=1 Tax=Janthinobacterium agaricidamnosum NBRC 102515 = DSM 9628 TaxID=1349767 RepID=W0V499_9BURK|nr:PLP-dependent aminotransferase family protein [Janthinobacterium agaricidamnosum]CDG82087.1 bacterial regulatory s, gntR family protein [Janthinobacterium agaricidamnosum NBRC 102515 = DSM 9628]